MTYASKNEELDGILALVLQITPDLGFEKRGVVDAAVSISP
jgi:hypothetical protein